MKTRFLRIPEIGRFERASAGLIGGAALGQLATLAAAPWLSRLLFPEDFGAFAVLVSVQAVVGTVACLRMEQALLLPDARTARSLLFVGFISLGAIAALAALVLAVWAPEIARWAGISGKGAVLSWLPVILIAEGTFVLLSHVALRQRSYGRVSIARSTQGIVTAGAQLCAAFASMGSVALPIGMALGRAGGASVLIRQRLSTREVRAERRPSLNEIGQALWSFRRFPLLAAPGALANSAGVHAPAVLFTYYYGAAAGGLYLFAIRVVEAPILLVGQSVAHVILGEGSNALGSDPQDLLRLARVAARRLAFVLGPPIALLGLAAPWLFEAIFGSDWQSAGEFVQLLVPALLVRSVVAPLAVFSVLLNRQKAQALWDVIRLGSVVGAMILAANASWSAHGAVGLLSGVHFVLYVALGLMIRFFLRAQPPVLEMN